MAGGKMNRGEVLRVCLMAAFIIGGVLMLKATPWGKLTLGNIDTLRDALRQWGAWAWACFLVAGTLLLSFGFPRLVLSAIGGATFGVVLGTLLAELATTLSAIPPFYVTKFLGRGMVDRRLRGRLQKLNALLDQHGFMVMLLIRLCPVGNSFVTNTVAGVCKIRFSSYILSSAIGFLPMTFICAMFGKSMIADPGSHFRLWISGGMFVAFTLFFLWYFRTSTLARDVMAVMRETREQPSAEDQARADEQVHADV